MPLRAGFILIVVIGAVGALRIRGSALEPTEGRRGSGEGFAAGMDRDAVGMAKEAGMRAKWWKSALLALLSTCAVGVGACLATTLHRALASGLL